MIDAHNVTTHIEADPQFENLHSDPRRQALLRRMNFPPE
jgi:hypothetical protein